MNWSSRPFVRILIFYLAGIFLADKFAFIQSLNGNYLLVEVIIFILIAIFSFHFNRSWRLRWISGLALGFAIMLTAGWLTYLNLEKTNIELPEGEHTYIGVLTNQVSVSEHSVKSIFRIKEVIDTAVSMSLPVNAMIYMEKDSLSEKLKYGDLLIVSTRLNKPGKPLNPGEFDYGSFLLRNGISATCYVQRYKWHKIGNQPENRLMAFAIWARQQLLHELQKKGLNENEYAVASAVLLGYDETMDADLQQRYAVAGAMHILCVSGLHVGIVYLVLNYLLGFLFRKRKWAILIKTTLIIVFIWAYAMLTGLAPSVWRAALMLTIFIIGTNLNRSREPYNTLAAAAVIMLVINPMNIYNVGFQLSFSAVLGILYFYQPLYGLIYVRNTFLNKIWSIVVVSTAAQLGTFPIAAHYFHFLPTYFWLTNIVIFPLSFAIIGIGLIFIILFWIPIVSNILGFLLSGSVFLMNQLVSFVKYLPFSGLEDLYFPWIKVFIIYGLIIVSSNWLIFKNLRYILPTILILFALLVFQTFRNFQLLNQKKLIVYSIAKASGLTFIQGRENFIVMDSTLMHDQAKIDYHLKPGFINMGLSNPKINDKIDGNVLSDLYFDDEIGQFADYGFAVINDKNTWYPSRKKLKINALIIAGSSRTNIEELSTCFEYNSLIIDGSVPYWKRKRIKAYADEMGISCYDLSKTGAFIREF